MALSRTAMYLQQQFEVNSIKVIGVLSGDGRAKIITLKYIISNQNVITGDKILKSIVLKSTHHSKILHTRII